MVLDKSLARELTLYIENDGGIYKSVTTPLINNYARKKLRGVYNKQRAIKGILMIVEAGRRKYIRDFGSIGGNMSMETKIQIAKELYPMIDEESTYEAKRLRKQAQAKSKLKKIVKRKH